MNNDFEMCYVIIINDVVDSLIYGFQNDKVK